MILIAVLLTILPQDATDLIEELGAERIEDRDTATRAIRAMGDRALPTLRKALDKADSETRGRILNLLAELEWAPQLPVWLPAHFPNALSVLTAGAVEERRAMVQTLSEKDLLPPGLAERIVLSDSDADVRCLAAPSLFSSSSLRHRPAYYRLLEDLPAMVRRDRAIHPQVEFLPTPERFLEAFRQVIDATDAEALGRFLAHPDRSVAVAAEVLLAQLGRGISRERLGEMMDASPYPIAALACEESAKRFGPQALPSGRFEEAWLRGLLSNGSEESLQAIERHAENLAAGFSPRALPLLARAGTESMARCLLDHALRRKEGYEREPFLDALRSMPPAILSKALKERANENPEILVRFTSMILHQGDEEIMRLHFGVRNAEPANLYYWAPPMPRPELTRVCRRVLDEGGAPWAVRYAYRQLSRFDPEGRARRAARS